MIPCLAYVSTLKIDDTYPPKSQFTFTGLCGLISQNTENLIVTAVISKNLISSASSSSSSSSFFEA
jgi:hypothetical protein